MTIEKLILILNFYLFQVYFEFG